MKFPSLSTLIMLLLTIVALLASTTNAACYKNGFSTSATQQSALREDLLDICKRYLAGEFEAGGHREVCWNFINRVVGHFSLHVYNYMDRPVFNSVAGCMEMLRREIPCWHGGDTTHTGPGFHWRFIVDPNPGWC